MSRDMKPRRNTASPKKKSGGGTLIGLFIGLVIGIIAAAVVVLLISKTPPPFTNKNQPAPEATTNTGTPAAPMPLPGKPGDPVPESDDKPRFDFYKILPGNAEAIPDPKATDTKEEEAKPGDKTKEKEKTAKEEVLKTPVFLQTGSFQNAADADNQKAKIALMGAEAEIQQVMLQDKVWYRVRLGPFKKMDEVNNVRSELAKQGVDANVVKKD